MIQLEFRFPAGRWHATASGTHVNEGVPEWPPSPWRICRALYAIWFHKHQATIPRSVIDGLIEDLIEAPLPRFHLPVAVAAHTRHYMPTIEGKKEAKTKIFDTFVQFSKSEDSNRIGVQWEVTLASDQRLALADVLDSMSYFGRAESLVEASLLPEDAPPLKINSMPVFTEDVSDHDAESTRLLAPLPQQEYALWRKEVLTRVSEKGGRKKKVTLPDNVRDCLLLDTADWKAQQWSQAPGSRWVIYQRPARAFRIRPRSHKPTTHTTLPTLARFAIAGDVPPDITQALSLGNRMHLALVKWSDGAPVFTGCDDNGKPLTGHQHAFYLSEPSGSRGEIRYINIYAPMGFGLTERKALERLRSVWDYDSRRLKIVLVSLGHAETRDNNESSPLFATASVWTSITPFVPTRHAKTTKNGTPKRDEHGLQIGSPEHDLLRLLQSSRPELPTPSIERLANPQLGRSIPWLAYQQNRRNGKGTRAQQLSQGFRLTFPEPISGPISLGYGAHFGLGLFVPLSD